MLVACGRAEPEPAHPMHDADGVRFEYPDGWDVSTDSDAPKAGLAERFVSVEGPEDAVLLVHRIAGDTRSPEAYARDFVGGQLGRDVALRGRPSAVTADVAGRRLEGIRMVVELGPVGFATTVFRVDDGSGAAFVVSQATLADERLAEEGFALVRRTLRIG